VNNSDVCVTGVSGAVQTSLFGVSGGGTVRDKNCEILKLSRTLYGAGLKVAAVSLLCQDARVFAKKSWVENPAEAPEGTKLRRDARKKAEAIEAAKAAKESAEEPTNEYPE
jgi:hypothetical protein